MQRCSHKDASSCSAHRPASDCDALDAEGEANWDELLIDFQGNRQCSGILGVCGWRYIKKEAEGGNGELGDNGLLGMSDHMTKSSESILKN